jgi:hypothetical protein
MVCCCANKIVFNEKWETDMAIYARPHSKEWFSALEKSDPGHAAHTRMIIKAQDNAEICSVCGAEDSCDFKIVHPVPAEHAVGTIRLCDQCRHTLEQRKGQSFAPFP